MRRYFEKYILQDYDRVITDTFINDCTELDNNALNVFLCLYKYSFFCIKRKLTLNDINGNITFIYYDSNADDSDIVNNVKRIGINLDVAPSRVHGYTDDGEIVIFIKVNTDNAPFSDNALNNEIDYDMCDEVSESILDKCNYIIVNNFNSLDLTKCINGTSTAVKELLSMLPVKCKRAKKTLNISYIKPLSTLKHELTHLFDTGGALDVNHYYSSIKGVEDYYRRANFTCKIGLELANTILYKLWTFTEFNAFTQTYGMQKLLKRKNDLYSDNIDPNMLENPGEYTLQEYVDNVYSIVEKLESSDYDEDFWNAVKKIAIDGADKNKKEIYSNMSATKFKNYFLNTTIKLANKFKDKAIKNVYSRNERNKDIVRIANIIKNACNNTDINSKNIILRFRFNYYFASTSSASNVEITFISNNIKRLSDNEINKSTMMYIKSREENIDLQLKPDEFFNNVNNSFCRLFRELKSGSVSDNTCKDLADDLMRELNNI